MVTKLMSGVHLIVICLFSFITAWLAKKKIFTARLRELPALRALEECVGRSVEMGRPIIFSFGALELRGTSGGEALAGFAILGEVQKQCIQKGATLIPVAALGEQIPIIESIMEETYIMEGQPDLYNPRVIQFTGGTQNSLVALNLKLIETERPASFIHPGGTGGDVVIYGEAAARVGAISICGLTNLWQLPYAVSAYDYWLFGEDLLAASAMLTKDPMQTANITASDIYRYLIVAVIVLGSILTWVGMDFVKIFSGG